MRKLPPAALRIFEGICIFILIPAWVAWAKPLGYVYLILWLLMAYCAVQLRLYHSWTYREDWNQSAVTNAELRRIVLRFLPFAAALTAFTLYKIPESFLALPRGNVPLWLGIILLYPPLSVIPQEIIARSFFFRRYGDLLSEWHLKLFSALAFGWMHIIMRNWEAVLFSAIGGWLFADTYSRTRSLSAVFFEHAIYGCFVFSIGLGAFFYHGHAMRQ